jgi:hypothetical protein
VSLYVASYERINEISDPIKADELSNSFHVNWPVEFKFFILVLPVSQITSFPSTERHFLCAYNLLRSLYLLCSVCIYTEWNLAVRVFSMTVTVNVNFVIRSISPTMYA